MTQKQKAPAVFWERGFRFCTIAKKILKYCDSYKQK